MTLDDSIKRSPVFCSHFIGSDASDAGPEPASFEALTRNWYSTPSWKINASLSSRRILRTCDLIDFIYNADSEINAQTSRCLTLSTKKYIQTLSPVAVKWLVLIPLPACDQRFDLVWNHAHDSCFSIQIWLAQESIPYLFVFNNILDLLFLRYFRPFDSDRVFRRSRSHRLPGRLSGNACNCKFDYNKYRINFY